ncbi:DUF3737 family protein [Bacillus toyonensis]|uniref:DUF3737 domain-containing protein n=1 Tax=Bacillus toyonensis TaxID=155322 RepID=A0A2A7YBV1_9BACI|nr:DUF3737 family protein [Bacillus toyonensis]PEK83213.1 hypothetical protein CN594_21120 [Bacillus toyonensis]PEL15596.1 hypothetical protein CN624_31280 [Bacillus toyonensis]PEO39082.1 hypothetical protein CN579_35175 [Bacillus toyonensis]PFY36833.1 hypothetical protein COL54_25525 [Bacillus toyonensis]PFY37754.1 hypothetical protein COL55_27210 [Bacillus toyonensis]
MEFIEKGTFKGERPLFKMFNVQIKDSDFLAGESAIKRCKNVKVFNCNFYGKYPLWHNNDLEIQDSYFSEVSRAAIWYTSNVILDNCKVNAPKMFRDAQNITINKTIMDTEDTLWDCTNVKISDSEFTGQYLLLHGNNIKINNLKLDGKYSFQHVKKGVVRNSLITSKDAFWNSENITIYDSTLNGEYLGWHSKHLKLVNCKIIGAQPLCYADNLILENCQMFDTNLSFEYSTVQAEIINTIDSIKNPISGVIKAACIKEIIMDDPESLNIQIITNSGPDSQSKQ